MFVQLTNKMKEKKNIDRLFQEKFKDFEVAPEEAVWEKIRARQQQKKKRGLLLPFWYRAAGVAAMLAIIAGIGYFSRNSDPIEDIVLEDATTQDTKETSSPSDINQSEKEDIMVSSNQKEVEKSSSENHKDQNQSNHSTITNVPKIVDNIQKATANASEPKPEAVTNKNPKTNYSQTEIANNSTEKNSKPNEISNKKEDDLLLKQKQTDNAITHQKSGEKNPEEKDVLLEPTTQTSDSKETVIAQSYNTNKNSNNRANDDLNDKTIVPEDQNKKSIFDAISQEEEAIVQEETTDKKWNVSPNIAPVYYNSIGNGSPIDPQFADNGKNGQVNLSYGVQIAYKVNDKLSIRSGVNKVDLSYNTQDIGFSPSSIVSQNLQSINYSPNAQDILVSDIGSNRSDFAAQDFNREAINQTQNEGLLNQRIGYIEVPLEMKYALVNKKLGVNMIGGVSTLFLQDNEVSIEAGDFETSIGEANNLNNVSFTGNIGMGFDYKLSDQFQLNLEPIFKYQFNGFSGNTENFRPYYFGVYTGVSIKF